MARPLTQAEKWRAHRAAFELALELGCTPKEATREMERIAARERHRASSDRLAAKMAAPLGRAPESPTAAADEPWMMRD